MGIALGALQFLLDEGAERPWSGEVLTLGRQTTSVTADEFRRLIESGNPARAAAHIVEGSRVLSDKELFRGLGFKRLVALDAHGYEKPDVVHDLNHADLPIGLAGRFDLVFDGGTLEHVFDVATALRTLGRFVKTGGRIVHLSPMSNCVDHGFYSFSPTLFIDFYTANDWIVHRVATARFETDPSLDPWEVRNYHPRDFARLGVLASGCYFLLTCVEAKENSRTDVIPQQSYYTQVWHE